MSKIKRTNLVLLAYASAISMFCMRGAIAETIHVPKDVETIQGAIELAQGDDIILVVQGPATDIIQRRKAKRAGIWVNV